MPSKLEERVLAAARSEAAIDVTYDFTRVERYVETETERAVVTAMKERAYARSAAVAEDRALVKLQRWVNHEPTWWERLLLRLEDLL